MATPRPRGMRPEEGRKKRGGDAGSVADLARRRTTAALPTTTTGYAAKKMIEWNLRNGFFEFQITSRDFFYVVEIKR